MKAPVLVSCDWFSFKANDILSVVLNYEKCRSGIFKKKKYTIFLNVIYINQYNLERCISLTCSNLNNEEFLKQIVDFENIKNMLESFNDL